MTKDDLFKLLDPYGPGEQIVFVTFEDGIIVHEEAEVAKDHSTKRTLPGGGVSMPVAIYLTDPGQRGKAGVLGVKDVAGLLPGIALVKAAETLLGHRKDSMDTIEEWLALARAVAACTGRKPGDYLTARDLQRVVEYDLPWNEDTDGTLPDDGD